MKLIKAMLLLAFLFVPMVGAYSITVTANEYLTIGLPSKPLPGQGTEEYGESEQGSSEEANDDNTEGISDSDGPAANDTERFEDWYEPDPAYQ